LVERDTRWVTVTSEEGEKDRRGELERVSPKKKGDIFILNSGGGEAERKARFKVSMIWDYPESTSPPADLLKNLQETNSKLAVLLAPNIHLMIWFKGLVGKLIVFVHSMISL
jgi:hypothetical protein